MSSSKIPRKYLFVIGHPSELGWVRLMVEQACLILEKNGDKFQVIDLYRSDKPQYFLDFKQPRTYVDEYQAQINWCDELTLAYPMWWGAMPAILKNWIDVNFEAKYAYHYKKDTFWYKLTGLPHGALKHVKVNQLVTCGGASWKYVMLFSAPTNLVRLVFIMFCGMQQGWVKMYGSLATTSEEKRGEIVKDFTSWFARKIR